MDFRRHLSIALKAILARIKRLQSPSGNRVVLTLCRPLPDVAFEENIGRKF
jgi:hypothetical protein